MAADEGDSRKERRKAKRERRGEGARPRGVCKGNSARWAGSMAASGVPRVDGCFTKAPRNASLLPARRGGDATGGLLPIGVLLA